MDSAIKAVGLGDVTNIKSGSVWLKKATFGKAGDDTVSMAGTVSFNPSCSHPAARNIRSCLTEPACSLYKTASSSKDGCGAHWSSRKTKSAEGDSRLGAAIASLCLCPSLFARISTLTYQNLVFAA